MPTVSPFANLKKNSEKLNEVLLQAMKNESTKFKDDRFWVPDVDKSGNGFHTIRFLPAKDNNTHYVKYYSHSFQDSSTSRWFIHNCPTSIGLPCPVCEHNVTLWNTGNKAQRDIVTQRKRKINYISNIVILSDQKRPENVNKVFLFKFGTTIFNIIKSAIEPEFADETPFNPFNLWTGANLKLKIINRDMIRNYSKSEWSEIGPLYPTDDEIEKIWNAQHDLQEFLNPKQYEDYAELRRLFYSTINKTTNDDNSSPFDDANTDSMVNINTDDMEMFKQLVS